jgi:hypothetical protein
MEAGERVKFPPLGDDELIKRIVRVFRVAANYDWIPVARHTLPEGDVTVAFQCERVLAEEAIEEEDNLLKVGEDSFHERPQTLREGQY